MAGSMAIPNDRAVAAGLAKCSNGLREVAALVNSGQTTNWVGAMAECLRGGRRMKTGQVLNPVGAMAGRGEAGSWVISGQGLNLSRPFADCVEGETRVDSARQGVGPMGAGPMSITSLLRLRGALGKRNRR